MPARAVRTVAAAAVATGVTALALAAPAAAMLDPAPPPASEVTLRHTQHGGSLTQAPTLPPTTVSSEDSPWAEIGLAALGGLALAGVGIGASAAVRRRSVAHTA